MPTNLVLKMDVLFSIWTTSCTIIQRATGYRHHFFSTRVVKMWNSLSDDTVQASTVNKLKSRLWRDWRGHPDLYNNKLFQINQSWLCKPDKNILKKYINRETTTSENKSWDGLNAQFWASIDRSWGKITNVANPHPFVTPGEPFTQEEMEEMLSAAKDPDKDAVLYRDYVSVMALEET